jgi:hypothetical protein
MSGQGDAALSFMDKHGVSKPWISTPQNNRRYLILQGGWRQPFLHSYGQTWCIKTLDLHSTKQEEISNTAGWVETAFFTFLHFMFQYFLPLICIILSNTTSISYCRMLM